MHASASAAISSGTRGAFGLRSLVVVPLIAASMITGPCLAAFFALTAATVGRVAAPRGPPVPSPRRAHRPDPGSARAPAGAARVLRGAHDARAPQRSSRAATPAARRTGRWCASSGPTASSAPAGRRSGAGRAARRSSSTSSTTRRTAPACRLPLVTLNTVGPTLMLYGSDEQKEHFLPQILAGELHFAIGYSEPGAGTDLASVSTPRRPRRRRVRDQRPEGLHHRRPRRRLDLARLPHRSRREEAQGHLDHPRAHRRAGVQAHADLGARRRAHERHVLRGRARPGHQRRARGERGLEAHHEPAQPRARRAGPGRQARPALRRGPRLGAGDAPRRRHARHRPGVGAADARSRARGRRDGEAPELARRRGAGGGRAQPRAMRPR